MGSAPQSLPSCCSEGELTDSTAAAPPGPPLPPAAAAASARASRSSEPRSTPAFAASVTTRLQDT